MRVRYAKRGRLRFTSHRDFSRAFERALVRAIVDSKRTAGTWFFAGAIIVFIGSTGAMPREVQLGAKLGDRVQVVSGLLEGDRIVTSANFLLDSESSLKAALIEQRGAVSHPFETPLAPPK